MDTENGQQLELRMGTVGEQANSRTPLQASTTQGTKGKTGDKLVKTKRLPVDGTTAKNLDHHQQRVLLVFILRIRLQGTGDWHHETKDFARDATKKKRQTLNTTLMDRRPC